MLLPLSFLAIPFLAFAQPQQQQRVTNVHICGQYPNRYFSYEPCPEGENVDPFPMRQNPNNNQQQNCRQPGWTEVGVSCRTQADCTRALPNVRSQWLACDNGQCCESPQSGSNGNNNNNNNNDATYWQTCENGGYFTGQNCRTTQDCRRGRLNDGRPIDSRLARYTQICLNGECCTTNQQQQQNDDNNNNGNNNGNNAARNLCRTFGGQTLSGSSCSSHGDCNRLVGSRTLGAIRPNEQLGCVQGQCCLMERQLPPGITSWTQVCENGGEFTGMFCWANDRDCEQRTAAIGGYQQRSRRRLVCQLNRYCCSYADLRPRRQGNQGCDVGDRVSGSNCDGDQDCFPDEYCGDAFICCQRRSTSPNFPGTNNNYDNYNNGAPAYCYNGEQSQVSCSTRNGCLQTQACINGLCCIRSGDEYKYACGGQMAVSSCFQDRTCHSDLVCTTSDYCCECRFGQTAGKCGHGCPPNFSCENNYCCPRCANGAQPYGSCFNGQCSAGHTCMAGNICCRQ